MPDPVLIWVAMGGGYPLYHFESIAEAAKFVADHSNAYSWFVEDGIRLNKGTMLVQLFIGYKDGKLVRFFNDAEKNFFKHWYLDTQKKKEEKQMKNNKVTTVAAPEEPKNDQWMSILWTPTDSAPLEIIVKNNMNYNKGINLTKEQAIIVKKAIEAFFGD